MDERDYKAMNAEIKHEQMTAVSWYEIEINLLIEKYEAKEISKRDFITMKHNLFYPAKEMQKQQIINAVDCCFASLKLSDDKTMFVAISAEQYYNETYKNTEK